MSDHNGAADALFQFSQPSMDGGLAQPERLCGGDRAAMAGDRQKMPKIVPVKHELFTLDFARRNLAAAAHKKTGLTMPSRWSISERLGPMRRKSFDFFVASALAGLGVLLAGEVTAQEVVKVGLVMPLTGVLGPVGKQAVAGARLYLAQHGDMVAGRKIELIVRDDASVPDNSKRITQELIVSQKVAILGGGMTPNGLGVAPLVNER